MHRPAVLAALLFPLAAPADIVSPDALAGWRRHSFSGETAYELVVRDGRPAIHALCDASASGLFRDTPVDLNRTPVIEWRWRVDNLHDPVPDETTRRGDDFAARLYVVRDGGVLPWRTRALNYVWTVAKPGASDWPNPFAAQARMVALRTAADTGAWQVERRNIREDFRRFHGLEADSIDAVAIMTDCDNRPGTAEAWYGEIRFLPAD
jgi:hypothetical protein